MKRLILHQTSTAGWQELIFQAQKQSAIVLPEEMEAYLVFLLMRFTNHADIAASVLALEFLESLQQHPGTEPLKEVGDKCLLVAGLFPGRAKRKKLPPSYFIRLGQTAYSSLSEQATLKQALLYSNLCHAFPRLTNVLQSLRTLDSPQTVFHYYEQWQDTHSVDAWNKLCEATPLLSNDPNNNKLVN